MLGKFKGFYVPGKEWKEAPDARSVSQAFCYKCKSEDCGNIPDDEGEGNNCQICLFDGKLGGDPLEKAREKAFQEWHKAKGKVEYDA